MATWIMVCTTTWVNDHVGNFGMTLCATIRMAVAIPGEITT